MSPGRTPNNHDGHDHKNESGEVRGYSMESDENEPFHFNRTGLRGPKRTNILEEDHAHDKWIAIEFHCGRHSALWR